MFIEKCIIPCNIDFKRQYYLPEIKQFCDIYIPKKNLIIEFNGTYWHCDRRFYPNGPKNKTQENKVNRDEIKYNFLNKNGYNLLIIREYDFKNNIEKVKNDIQFALNE